MGMMVLQDSARAPRLEVGDSSLPGKTLSRRQPQVQHVHIVLDPEGRLLASLNVVDNPPWAPKMTLLPCMQICLTLDRGRVMSTVCQFVWTTSFALVTIWMCFSPSFGIFFPPAAVYI